MAFQSKDLLEAMRPTRVCRWQCSRSMAGASVNNTLMQFQADILNATVRRPVVAETTALGAAYLAGLAVGYWKTSRYRPHWHSIRNSSRRWRPTRR